MLVGIVARPHGRAARELVRAETILGPAQTRVAVGGVALAAWPNEARVPVSVQPSHAVEGWPDAIGKIPFDLNDWIACLSRLAGDYALIAAHGGQLVVGSGRGAGYRPVFVSRLDTDVAIVCSRLEPLIRLTPSLAECLDVDHLASRVCVRRPLANASTPFAGVHQVPPLEAWVVSATGEHRRRSTFLPLANQEALATEEDLAEQLRDELKAAVRRCIDRTDTAGVVVSGGLDSSSVMALSDEVAAEYGRAVLPIYWRFETKDSGSDRQYVDALARHRSLRLEPLDPTAASPQVQACLVADAMPCWSVTSALWVTTGKLASARGVRLLLTGLGGDNVVEGDQRALAVLARHGHLFRALTLAARLKGSQPADPPLTLALRSISQSVARPLVAPFVPRRLLERRRARALSNDFPWAGPRMRQHLREQAERSKERPTLVAESPAERYQALARMHFMWEVETIRSQEEPRMGCARADPFFDDQLLRFVATLPPISLLHGGFRRGLLRAAMRGLLPDDLRLRTNKASLASASRQLIEGAGGVAAFRSLADARMLGDLGLVEPKRILSHFDRAAGTSEGPAWGVFWSIFSTEAFLRQVTS